MCARVLTGEDAAEAAGRRRRCSRSGDRRFSRSRGELARVTRRSSREQAVGDRLTLPFTGGSSAGGGAVARDRQK
ncbi:hypothetical protein GUJ93_ZPchr0008g12410 [Zizania palustris]|uniref:Uncharacterized protein n=1 Tax=Zizania palustris TaxID=103762 RepID=A0A8J5RK14_ZIZPA|nr:hypothetical protein GUJ93_ZPchr0008g12410 [Zizania palustris]